MNNKEKLRAIVENYSDGMTDEEVRVEAGFKTKNQANVVLNNLAKDGRILRYKPDGEKSVLMNYPLSTIDDVERNEYLISFISQQSNKGEEQILAEALNVEVGESAGNMLINSLAKEIAENTGKTSQAVMLEAITEHARKHRFSNVWKNLLIAKVNSERIEPSRVITESLVNYLKVMDTSPVKDDDKTVANATGEEDVPHPDDQEQQEQ